MLLLIFLMSSIYALFVGVIVVPTFARDCRDVSALAWWSLSLLSQASGGWPLCKSMSACFGSYGAIRNKISLGQCYFERRRRWHLKARTADHTLLRLPTLEAIRRPREWPPNWRTSLPCWLLLWSTNTLRHLDSPVTGRTLRLCCYNEGTENDDVYRHQWNIVT